MEIMKILINVICNSIENIQTFLKIDNKVQHILLLQEFSEMDFQEKDQLTHAQYQTGTVS